MSLTLMNQTLSINFGKKYWWSSWSTTKWCYKEMRLKVHFASTLSTQNLSTNQSKENSQEQKLLKFWRRWNLFSFENSRTSFREIPMVIFLGKINYLTRFWHFHKLKKVFSNNFYTQKMLSNIFRLVALIIVFRSRINRNFHTCSNVAVSNFGFAFWLSSFESSFFEKMWR